MGLALSFRQMRGIAIITIIAKATIQEIVVVYGGTTDEFSISAFIMIDKQTKLNTQDQIDKWVRSKFIGAGVSLALILGSSINSGFWNI